VIVGGAPVTPEFAASIGADHYAPDAGAAADVAKLALSGA
jgi:methanogenic corrinoid protein MtbC1